MSKWIQIFASNPITEGESKLNYFKRIAEQENCDWHSVKTRYYTINKPSHTAMEEEAEKVGIPSENVSQYWYKGKHFSLFVKQDKLDVNEILSTVCSILDQRGIFKAKKRIQTGNTNKALNVVLSDMHIGLEPNPEGRSLYKFEYNEQIFMDNLQSVFQSIMKEYATHGKFDMIVLDDLGDGLDGYNGFTTRGGHKLDQNMTNIEAFKAYVSGKLWLIEQIIIANICNKVYVRNVSRCNHSGDWGYMANETIKMILERCYHEDDVKFYILERFMEHFTYGDHCFILTHGKDDKNMSKSLPLILNDRTITYITDYIEHYEINSKYIHVFKGDLHQVGYQRTKKFDYRNFMSFAPPSSYVQHNFGISYSGYSIEVIPEFSGAISHTDYFFDLKK